MALNLKLKKNLKDRLEKEGSNKKDTRFLNYFDMKFEEKMKILILPDVNGELWAKFKMHGPNLNNKKVGAVNCSYMSSGEECPACQHGFDYLNMEKETGDEAYKDEAKRWFAKDYTIMSVLVLESSMEIQESPDGNQVKLMYVPFKVEQMIKNAVVEGQIEEDMLSYTPLWLKKTKNKGGRAAYDNSYFDRKEVTDDDLQYFAEQKVDQFDYTNLDVIPKPTSTAEVQTWLDKALEIMDQEDGSSSDDKADESKSDSKPTPKPKKEKVEKDEDPEEDDSEESQDEPEEESDEGVKSESDGGSLKDRLAKLRK